MGTGILLSSNEIDFMVHGIFQYEFFGQTRYSRFQIRPFHIP